MGRIALTGTASFLGARLLRRLVEDRGPDGVVAMDIAHPPPGLSVVRFRELDLTEPVSDQKVLDVLREEEVDTIVHLAFFTNPQRDRTYAHELESIGTLNLFAGAAAAGVKRVVMRSFTAVYGARGENPSFLTEDRPLQPNLSLAWARDKLEAEQHAASFARRYPGMSVAVLRLAPLFGPGVHNFYTSIFDKRVVPVLMGYDPLVQLLHPDDALAAFELAPEEARRAAPSTSFRPARSRFRPPSTWPTRFPCRCRTRSPTRCPRCSGSRVSPRRRGPSWTTSGILFVADGAKAQCELGFTARHSSREALRDYLQLSVPGAVASGGGGCTREHTAQGRPLLAPTAEGRRRARAAARARPSARAGAGLGRRRPAGVGEPKACWSRWRSWLRRARAPSTGRAWRGRCGRPTSPGTRRRSTSSAMTAGSPETLEPFFEFLYTVWWRVETTGIEHVPAKGPGLIVANHSGVLPWDGLMINVAMRHEHPARRHCRMLALDMFALLPFLAPLLSKGGHVRASQENGERLLRKGELVGVFPEGVKGVGKPFKRRYKLARFGRGGFVRLALRTGTPIIPCAVVGAEEVHPMLANASWIAKPLGFPYFPLTPTWPHLGLLGTVPLPTKWSIDFADPLPMDSYGPEAAEDTILVHRLSEQVRSTVQKMINGRLARRRSIWFG